MILRCSGAASIAAWNAWTPPNAQVHHYVLERKQTIRLAFAQIAEIDGSATSYLDSSVTGGTAYLYRIRAACPSGSLSSPSNVDLATAMNFTDDPLVAEVTGIKAQHINELRAGVNAVRATALLAPASWTDSALQGIPVQAVHITELRQNLNQALQALGFTPIAYTDNPLNPGVIVKKAHIEDIRQALR
jgi:hypothetical protein